MRALQFLGAAIVLLGAAPGTWAKTVHYDLTATRGSVNLSGRKTVDSALLLNGSIPAPTLEFNEGDDAEIVVTNHIPGEELSLHWHGILLPSPMDGVPYLTTPPIRSGESYTFRFKLRQHGTYWYHSHTEVQEQRGLFGAIVIHPRQEQVRADREAVVMLNDWTDEDAEGILRNLKKDGDYYLYKKGTVRSWLGAIQAGHLGAFLENEWTRMGAMDLSDVGYDAFLLNGKRDTPLVDASPGQTVRLRIINGSSSTYIHVALGNSPMTVVAADGGDIQPVMAHRLQLGMAETYDVVFTVPDRKSYELRATAQDGTGFASGWIGSGEKVPAPDEAKPELYASMDHEHHHGGGGGGGAMHMMNGVMMHHVMDQDLVTVDTLRARERTSFAPGAPVRELRLVLGGDMSRYVWYINGKTMSQDMKLDVQAGEVVRIRFINETMMHHPMHLHGHFFRVVSDEAGEFSPLKHTVDVPPHGTRLIEFRADEPGRWMLHCHNLYHMKSGMGRVVNYLDYQPASGEYGHSHRDLEQAHHQDPHMQDDWYFAGNGDEATNHAQWSFRLSQSWNEFDLRLEGRNTSSNGFSYSAPWEFETDLLYRRWMGNFLSVVGGAVLFDHEVSAVAGLGYRLPFLVEAQALVTHQGKFRFDLTKRFQWTSRIFTDADVTWRPGQAHDLARDWEWEVSLMYGPAWSWAVGLMLTDDSLGVGAEIRF